MLADARTFLQQLLAEIDRRGPKRDALKAWHAEIKKWQAEWQKFTAPNFELHASPIRPERIVADCRDVLPDDAILCCDVGVSHNWYMQFWQARRPQTMLNSWGFSGMGFGAAGALGAKLAHPDRPVVAVTGDGCFSMVPHVLCTAVEYDIPVVWVIWNNFGWVSIRDIQLGMFGGRELGTMFHEGPNQKPYNPDFAGWAKASGVEAMTITKSQDFKGALEHAVKANKPFLIDVHVDAEVRPPATGAWAIAADAAQGAGVRRALSAGRGAGEVNGLLPFVAAKAGTRCGRLIEFAILGSRLRGNERRLGGRPMPRHANYIPHGVIPAVLLPFDTDLADRRSQSSASTCATWRRRKACPPSPSTRIRPRSPPARFDEQRRVLEIAQDEIGAKLPLDQRHLGRRQPGSRAHRQDGGGRRRLRAAWCFRRRRSRSASRRRWRSRISSASPMPPTCR